MKLQFPKHLIFASLLTFAFVSLFAVEMSAQTGSWRGELDLGQMKLPLVFNFSKDASGQMQCTMDSPAQGAKGIPTRVTYCTSDSVALSCDMIGASYAGKIKPGLIKGQFSQRGMSFPLDLTPNSSIEERRPQTPKPPFPYTVTDTIFRVPDSAVLSATLTMPLTHYSKKIPALVMVTGSGPQNRDEELFEHKPFAVIADYLARNGIATLRYDDRGTGKSTGNFNTATTFTLKDDALSGVKLLRSIPAIGKVGVLGHSEGGTIAFMAGAEKKADFIVSLAGMALSGKETMLRQNRHSLEKAGLTGADLENSLQLIELYFDAIADRIKKGENAPIDLNVLAASKGLNVPQQIIQSLNEAKNQMRGPWFDAFLTLNPRKYLAKVKCPALAVNGSKDTQVNPDNLRVIKELAPHSQTLLMPDLNHLMQHAVTGEVAEYGEIRETVSPEVLETIAKFVKGLL